VIASAELPERRFLVEVAVGDAKQWKVQAEKRKPPLNNNSSSSVIHLVEHK
jgi:hypothetical protein